MACTNDVKGFFARAVPVFLEGRVEGCRARNSAPFHHREDNAVNQGKLFVGVGSRYLTGCFQIGGGDRLNGAVSLSQPPLKDVCDHAAEACAEQLPCLRQHEVGKGAPVYAE